jgi:hypothetical protein
MRDGMSRSTQYRSLTGLSLKEILISSKNTSPPRQLTHLLYVKFQQYKLISATGFLKTLKSSKSSKKKQRN